MKRFLLISYCFPPELSPASISLAKLLKHFTAAGWEITVICADDRTSLEPNDRALSSFIPERGVRIQRASSFESAILCRGARRMLPILNALPDAKSTWYPAARLAVDRALREERFAFMLSWSSSHASHVVALHARERSRLPWIAHFSDPWTDNPYLRYGALSIRVNRALERSVVEQADALVFNSMGVRDLMMRKYAAVCFEKTTIIPHSFDPSLYQTKTEPAHDRCIFTYTGSFYGLRSPMPLLRALRLLQKERPADVERMEFRLIGSTPARYQRAVREFGLASIVRIDSWVGYVDNLERMRQSDVLLVIDAPLEGESIFEPAKLIDYLGARKPVLAISSLNGVAGRMIRRFGAGEIVDPRDIDGIRFAIIHLFERWQRGDLAFPANDARVRSYEAPTVARQFVDLFERVTSQHGAVHSSATQDSSTRSERYPPQFTCPFCATVFDASSVGSDAEDVRPHPLRCVPCGAEFPVIVGIPRFVSGEQYCSSFGMQWRKHEVAQFDSRNGLRISRDRLRLATGWPTDLRGEQILEVGSGAGRFTEILASTGAEVWSFDLSSSVEVNHENNRTTPSLHIFQASVYDIPLPRQSFDKVLCLGVLQHTPDPSSAFRAIAEMVRSGGELVFDVYKRTLTALLHWKYALRPMTKRLPPAQLYRAVAWGVPKLLPLTRIARAWFGRSGARLFPIAEYSHLGLPPTLEEEWAILDTFDMYSPAHDHPQTIRTVRHWFDEAGFRDVTLRSIPNGIVGRGVKR